MTITTSRGAALRNRLRDHAPFLVALALGVAVRALVTVAYQPALLFSDSMGYLARADDLTLSVLRPSGYSLFLWLLQNLSESLLLVSVLQHLLGLGLAVACYAFLRRRALPGWGATLAALPLLLDPLQLVLEHYVLSDVLFETLLVGACLVLLWRRQPGYPAVLAVGLMVASAGLVRGAGTFLVAVFLVALLSLRVSWPKVALFVAAAVAPLATYATAFEAQHGDFALANAGPRFLYARLAPVAECARLEMPSYERELCPPEPVGQRPHTNWYMWAGKVSPQWTMRDAPQDLERVAIIKDFDQRVIRAQPVTYTRMVLRDLTRGFAPVRTYDVVGFPSTYWLFQDHYWTADTFHDLRVLIEAGEYGEVTYEPSAAQAMETYRTWLYTPGPVLAVLVVLAGAATLGLGRARRCGDRVAVGLLTSACLIPLLTSAALSGFSWRYQLPQLALLPPAGALGLAALLRGRAPGTPEPAPPVRVLDRAAALVTRLPMPARWRRVVERGVQRGWCQVLVALAAGAVAGWGIAETAVRSGWFTSTSATVIGVAAGVLLAGWLLLARWRAGPLPG